MVTSIQCRCASKSPCIGGDWKPEYPHRPAVHRNKPAKMRIRGSTAHLDAVLLAGQRNDANGYAGLCDSEAEVGVVGVLDAEGVAGLGVRRL